jgi:hypothetical protein
MVVNDSKKVPKSSIFFHCEICDYNTSRKSQLDRHLSTDKHKKAKMVVNDSKKVPKSSNFSCQCGKIYKFDTGLYRHKKLCDYSNNNTDIIKPIDISNNEMNDKELIINLIKQNNDLQTKVVELLKSGTNNTNNSYNKTFNLQFFLNDTCKDAMNITDFVNNLQLKLADLEKMGEIGYVNGISNIIIQNLKDMDITSRPIHCTDIKREVLYVKDEDKWDKEEVNHPKIRNAIKHIAHKNSKLLNDYKEKYPDYNNSNSKSSDNFEKLLIESMGGKGNNDEEKENKIIRNISKQVLIEKK